MDKLALPSELMSYIIGDDKYVYVSEMSGWSQEAEIKNFRCHPAGQGNILLAPNGAEFSIPSATLRRGNDETVILRDYQNQTTKRLKLNSLPLFQTFEMVIWTCGTALRGFAPSCPDKSDLALFLLNLEYNTKSENYYFPVWKEEIARLAKFLYKNNPEKTASRHGIDSMPFLSQSPILEDLENL